MNLETPTLLALIDEARAFEINRDLESEAEILKAFWTDFSLDPEVDGLAPEHQAEVFRLCGKFLSLRGKAKLISSFQERGKDFLTRSINTFETIGDLPKAAEAKCQLAFSYYFDGRTNNAEDVLKEAETCFALNKDHPAYLEIKINQLIILSQNNRANECVEIIRQIKPHIEKHCKPHIMLAFMNICGFVEYLRGNHQKSVVRYTFALDLAVKLGDVRAQGKALNNIAATLRADGLLEKALSVVKQAVVIAESLGDFGWLANYYDTQAAIESDLGFTEKALTTINKSLSYLETTTDSISHCASLWTKIEIYLRIGNTPEALLIFARLAEIATAGMGEKEAAAYAEKFAQKTQTKSASLVEDTKRITLFEMPADKEIFGALNDALFFLIPRGFSAILDQRENIVVCTENRLSGTRSNPVVLTHKITGEHFIGNYEHENFGFENELGFCILRTSPNKFADPLFLDPDEVWYSGTIVGFAQQSELKKKCVYFEKLESFHERINF